MRRSRSGAQHEARATGNLSVKWLRTLLVLCHEARDLLPQLHHLLHRALHDQSSSPLLT